ncbi:ferredoxin [Saccharopolyspora taberi]|uniref:Ferredoxin n=1 Tax=Saccharopolyspora taberi TaxID=60895 RepID=A0ABN3V3H8_9PSEU
MAWLIDVDSDTCIGSGMCVGTAPDHFELVDGFACPRKAEIEQADEVIDAAESCPVEAISVREAATGELLAPEE